MPGPPLAARELVVQQDYEHHRCGRREKVTDPKALDTKTTFDAPGRTVAKVEDQGQGNLNRKTEYHYKGLGRRIKKVV